MYINWAHYYIPKFNGLCSFLVNPLFIFIILNDKKLQLGNYRLLLLYFSIFNVTCSACDILVPMCVYDHRYAFSVFVNDGYFQELNDTNLFIMAFRCSFVAASYAILHSHFLYRFMVLFNGKFLNKYFLPYGMTGCIVYCIFHMIYWIVICCCFLGADRERRIYMRETIREEYGLDTMNINLLVALYREGSYDAIHKSIIGIVAITFLSVDSVVIYFVLGLQIIKKLNSNALIMSKKTKQLQRQLMKALVVQSVIPTFVSFLPCIFAWYQPIFGSEMGRDVYHGVNVAISIFPFLDPLAILFFVPTFRRRLNEILGSIFGRRTPAPPPKKVEVVESGSTRVS